VVENSGVDSHNGKFRLSVGKAKAGDKVGQLRVSFFWFFYSDYNILALGDEYDWVLVGSKSAKYLWILSRTPSLAEETLNHILDIATQRGYDTSKLIWVRQ
jgi:apolipoprotein D and lipocalin family protein